MLQRFVVIIVAALVASASAVSPARANFGSQESHPNPVAHSPRYRIQLQRIGHLASKGRVQDQGYNESDVVDRLIAMGTSCVPFLIGKLTDERRVKGDVIDFWTKVTVGDIAFIILTDFFLDSKWERSTIPGLKWDQFLKAKPNSALTGEQRLRRFIAKYGRERIRVKWQRVWFRYKNQLYWDEVERCFKVRKSLAQKSSRVGDHRPN
jgi:hypothetical protein